MLNVGDRVLILSNDYDEPGEPSAYSFEGERGVIKNIKDVPLISTTVKVYEVELLNQEKHKFLTESPEMHTWPFYAEELARV